MNSEINVKTNPKGTFLKSSRGPEIIFKVPAAGKRARSDLFISRVFLEQ